MENGEGIQSQPFYRQQVFCGGMDVQVATADGYLSDMVA